MMAGDLTDDSDKIIDVLGRIADALERQNRSVVNAPDFSEADAFVWVPNSGFVAVEQVNYVPLALLYGVETQRDQLLQNSVRFAAGLPANNALLWGARGMGKSSMVKAAHAEINAFAELGQKYTGVLKQLPEVESCFIAELLPLKLIEIHREDINSLPNCLNFLRGAMERFILFCDDLSFDGDDTSYKSLKAALEGGIEGRPINVVFYATSNRRHLLDRHMMDNERSTAINPSEAVEERVSLSDRFGLWLGFHHCAQEDYLAMVAGYADYYRLHVGTEQLYAEALTWARGRGARSGRVAWQFIQHLAGRLGQNLTA